MSLRGRIKLITFDATNTLLRFRVAPWKYYADVAREHGFEGTEAVVEHRFLSSFKTMSNEYPNFGKHTITWLDWWRQVVRLTFEGQLPATANVDCVASRLIEDFKTSKCWRLVDGGDKLIHLLRGYGIDIGVISNFDPRLNDILHNVNMHDVFDFIVTSYGAGFSKPDRRIFDHAAVMADKKLCSSQCLHIGDDVTKDYWGARKAGWHALLVTEKPLTEKPPAPEHVFKTLLDLSLAVEQCQLKL